MDHGIEQPLAPTLGALAVTDYRRGVVDVGNHLLDAQWDVRDLMR
jgi:hypothetical protein